MRGSGTAGGEAEDCPEEEVGDAGGGAEDCARGR